MENMPIDSYFFTEEEFYLLLTAVGVTRWSGICLSEAPPEPSSQAEVNRILAGLVQKGVAAWEGEELKLLSPFQEIFSVFRYAKTGLLSCVNGDPEGVACQYVYQGLVVRVSYCLRQTDAFRVTLAAPEAWAESLWEESYFSECIEDAGEKEPVDLKDTELLDCTVQNCQMEPVLSVFEKISLPDGEMQKRLISTDEGVYSYLYLSDREGCRRFPTTREKSLALLAELMREEDAAESVGAAGE